MAMDPLTILSIQSAASSVAGLATSYAASQTSRAQGIVQGAMYDIQAMDTLRLAGIRADQEERYAAIQAGRKLKQAEFEALNFKIQGNSLLRNLQRTNAAVRARAAANGVDINTGSVTAVQDYNVRGTYQDVGITDLNGLMARVLGFEDALNIYAAGKQQADFTREAADTQARELRTAGRFARTTGGLLGNAQLAQGFLNLTNTAVNPFMLGGGSSRTYQPVVTDTPGGRTTVY